MNGIICINKQQGYTSFDVVGKLRGILKIKKIGHGGTLDPMAVGVLPVFIGKATKACGVSLNNDKEYIAEVKFGISTDTQDITGRVICEKESNIDLFHLQEVVRSFIGNVDQLPPMYSAVKVGGKRLYKLARDGKIVERPIRKINIRSIDILNFSKKTQAAKLKVCCGKGTYIRTLVSDIGDNLEVGATLSSLIRTKTGIFDIEKSFTLEQVQAKKEANLLDEIVIATDMVFDKYPKISLNEGETSKFINGVKLNPPIGLSLSSDIKYRIYGFQNNFIGTAYVDQTQKLLRVDKMFI